MNTQWSLDTHGDPLGTVRELLMEIWSLADLAGMLVTMPDGRESRVIPRFITDKASIDRINPFKPLMEMNIARLIPGILDNHPHAWIGALLRPCELRALIEMTKHTQMNLDHLLTITVDCLGTLPADEYEWRLERMAKQHVSGEIDSPDVNDELAQEALKFARQGGVIPYRYRPACQVCISPAAGQADVNIQVLGLPVRQQLLLSISKEAFASGINRGNITLKPAEGGLILQHDHIVEKMVERHQRTMERVNEGLGSLLPSDVDAVIAQLEGCGDCQACMDVCPICSVDKPHRDTNGHYDRMQIMRWLISCAGCGMCEQSCPDHLPTAAIFAHIRQQLDLEWQYLPGSSTNDPLPNM
ncbi:MAG: hypothetical protein C3F13_11955 [Anaerolineales bacterium]|nr:hypothetical protein [Anaerolineae bacterium]PWB52235.1 MAG: hypothetical protein C3F13_11955 [Anaerolineales bacterium]